MPEGDRILRHGTPRGRSMRNLRRLECGLCGQRLDRMKRSAGNCSRMVGISSDVPDPGCTWHERLNADPKGGSDA